MISLFNRFGMNSVVPYNRDAYNQNQNTQSLNAQQHIELEDKIKTSELDMPTAEDEFNQSVIC